MDFLMRFELQIFIVQSSSHSDLPSSVCFLENIVEENKTNSVESLDITITEKMDEEY